MTIFSLVSTIQLRFITLGESNYNMYYYFFQTGKLASMFSGHYHLPCSKICAFLLSLEYLEELVMTLSGTHEEVSSIVPLIESGRPLRHLQLFLLLDKNSDCPPGYMLFYPSSLEKLELFCKLSKKIYIACEVNFNTILISQNANLEELKISVNCPYWDTILLSLAIANTSKLRSLMTYHYNNPSLIASAASSKLHHHLIDLHYLKELAITISGTENEVSSILQLIQPGKRL